jgi:hypothetical protein
VKNYWYGEPMGISHKGWELFTHADRDHDGFDKYSHYAIKGNERIELGGSPFYSSFNPTVERFAWLVDHNFPLALRGNWFSHEIDAIIEEERSQGDRPAQEGAVRYRERPLRRPVEAHGGNG